MADCTVTLNLGSWINLFPTQVPPSGYCFQLMPNSQALCDVAPSEGNCFGWVLGPRELLPKEMKAQWPPTPSS